MKRADRRQSGQRQDHRQRVRRPLRPPRYASPRFALPLTTALTAPVLKSTGSAFEGFVRDEHTTLVEVNDRIFSTAVDLKYTYAPFAVPQNTALDAFALSGALSGTGTAWDGNAVVAKARTATLEVFALDESASVQVCTCLCYFHHWSSKRWC